MIEKFYAAVTFLTILAKGKTYSDNTMRQSIYLYPAVGGIIFCICSVISLFSWFIVKNSWISAIIFLCSHCIIIRGLHHDGLADIADALGSGKTKEEFRTVLKDSRIGSFGVLSLTFYTLFSLVLIQEILTIHIKNESYWTFVLEMILVGLWSRLGLLALPLFSFPYIAPMQKFSLAQNMFAEFEKKYVLYWYISLFIVISLCYNASLIILFTSFSFFFTYPLYKTSQKENGYNGDFLGATCLLWEISAFFSLVIFYQQ